MHFYIAVELAQSLFTHKSSNGSTQKFLKVNVSLMFILSHEPSKISCCCSNLTLSMTKALKTV